MTEEVTGVDIVQSQIKIAGGASLADLGLGSQADVPPPYGFAIQCRVTSEDPEQNFQVRRPRPTLPEQPGLRGLLGARRVAPGDSQVLASSTS